MLKLANIDSQKKRIRQDEKRKANNSHVRSTLRTASKKVLKAIESKEETSKDILVQYFNSYVKAIDTAARKGILHTNTAARKKSRLARKINTYSQA